MLSASTTTMSHKTFFFDFEELLAHADRSAAVQRCADVCNSGPRDQDSLSLLTCTTNPPCSHVFAAATVPLSARAPRGGGIGRRIVADPQALRPHKDGARRAHGKGLSERSRLRPTAELESGPCCRTRCEAQEAGEPCGRRRPPCDRILDGGLLSPANVVSALMSMLGMRVIPHPSLLPVG